MTDTLKEELKNLRHQALSEKHKKDDKVVSKLLKELEALMRNAAKAGESHYVLRIDDIPSCEDKLYVFDKICEWARSHQFDLKSPTTPIPYTWLSIRW